MQHVPMAPNACDQPLLLRCVSEGFQRDTKFLEKGNVTQHLINRICKPH